jgi:hypothetical protein
MKLEGEYAVDKSEQAHRIASAVVYLLWIGLAFYNRGVGGAFKTAGYYFIPMACIWFSEAMATYTGYVPFIGGRIYERSHPLALRWGAWFLLLIAPLIVIFIFWLNK